MAARRGAVVADAEFVQFHPTALDVGRDPAPLVTEALRGEGATLIDDTGNRFMKAAHPLAELAPRDIVARAIHAEIMAGRQAFLDCRDSIGEAFADRFPTVYRSCMAAGIDPVTQPIPVAPAQHFHMGGLLSDASGRTTLDGLWACGEVASTGAHGANRLASNSLLEAVVFAARVAADIKEHFPVAEIMKPIEDTAAPAVPQSDQDNISALRRTMTSEVGVLRDAAGLRRALAVIGEIGDRSNSPDLLNMLTAAKVIAAAALARRESRGGHFRADAPDADPAWQRRTFMSLDQADPIAARAASVAPRLTAVVA
jgi:L-aspartate oxidase